MRNVSQAKFKELEERVDGLLRREAERDVVEESALKSLGESKHPRLDEIRALQRMAIEASEIGLNLIRQGRHGL